MNVAQQVFIDSKLLEPPRVPGLDTLFRYLIDEEGAYTIDSGFPAARTDDKSIAIVSRNFPRKQLNSTSFLLYLDGPQALIDEDIPDTRILSPYLPDEWEALSGIAVPKSIRSQWWWMPPLIAQAPQLAQRVPTLVAGETDTFLKEGLIESGAVSALPNDLESLANKAFETPHDPIPFHLLEATLRERGLNPLFIRPRPGNPLRYLSCGALSDPSIENEKLGLKPHARLCLKSIRNFERSCQATEGIHLPAAFWCRLQTSFEKFSQTPDPKIPIDILTDPRLRESAPPGWAQNWQLYADSWPAQHATSTPIQTHDWFSKLDNLYAYYNFIVQISASFDHAKIMDQALRPLAQWFLSIGPTLAWTTEFSELYKRFPNWFDLCLEEAQNMYEQNARPKDLFGKIAIGLWRHNERKELPEDKSVIAQQCIELYERDREAGNRSWGVYRYSKFPRAHIDSETTIFEQIKSEYAALPNMRNSYILSGIESFEIPNSTSFQHWVDMEIQAGKLNQWGAFYAVNHIEKTQTWDDAKDLAETIYSADQSIKGLLTLLATKKVNSISWRLFNKDLLSAEEDLIRGAIELFIQDIDLGRETTATWSNLFSYSSSIGDHSHIDPAVRYLDQTEDAWLNYANNLFLFSRHEEAKAVLGKIDPLRHTHGIQLILFASLSASLGYTRIARASYLKLQRKFPSLFRSGARLVPINQYLYHSWALTASGKPEAGRRFRKLAEERDPDFESKRFLCSKKKLDALISSDFDIPDFITD